MKISNFVPVLIFFASSSTSVWGAQESSSCGGFTQLELNYCASEKFKEADAKLNSMYKELMSQMVTPETKSRFRDAQRAWVSFRDKACLYEAGLRQESGSMWIMIEQNCMEYHTKKRIEDFKKYLSCTADDCPR